jgi:hypothetical protein
MNYAENSHLKDSLNSIKDMLIWIGADGQLLHANESALDFYGLVQGFYYSQPVPVDGLNKYYDMFIK